MPKSLVYATFLHVASPPRDERSSVRLLMDWKTASACSTAVWFDLLDRPLPDASIDGARQQRAQLFCVVAQILKD